MVLLTISVYLFSVILNPQGWIIMPPPGVCRPFIMSLRHFGHLFSFSLNQSILFSFVLCRPLVGHSAFANLLLCVLGLIRLKLLSTVLLDRSGLFTYDFGYQVSESHFFSSLISVIRHSVVRIMEATLAAFWRAARVTLTGSRIPALIMSSNSSVRALKP